MAENEAGIRMRGKRKRTTGDKKHAVKCDMFDQALFEKIKEQSSKLSAQDDKLAKDFPTFQDFHQDVFDALYKYTPEHEKSRNMKPGWEPNHTLADRMLTDSLWRELRGSTTLDEFGAAIATEVLTEHLSQFLPNVKAMPKKGKKDKPEDRTPEEKALRRAMQKALREAAAEADEMANATTCWGTSPGMAHKLPYKEKVLLAERIRRSKILRQLARIAGKFRNMALSTQRTKISKGNEEVYSIETGDRVNLMLPQELINMCNPRMKIDLFRRISSGEILQYALRDRKKLTKGPIVCCIDNSGSMSGDREVWSKAVALGLLEICNIQRRKFVGIHFSHGSNIQCFEFEPNAYDMNQVLDFVEWFFNGGTDFEKPLDVAADKVDENPRADIIMITDGECDVSDEWLRSFNSWRDEMECTVFGVLIEPYYHSERDHEIMKKFCNGAVVDAKDIMDDDRQGDSAISVFGSV
jgi:uncharacterized protein with von Willebrand factor type A (vWA) domain